uniref:PTN_MK_N domain-containing protein n=1 Tax=Macrostomum lignano TaxID=282301 RepID=A0A1I8J4M8_9PLAT
MLRKQLKPGGRGSSGGVGGGLGDSGGWWRLCQRKIAAACRPKVIARFLGAVLVAALVILLVSKGLSQRRRGGACRCAKFTYSQCQPYEGACGQGVKKAFCQQKRCQPRRKLVRCSVPCGRAGDSPAHGRIAGPCIYSVRRQSIWSLALKESNIGRGCCFYKQCIYEPTGSWSSCDRERNAIVNTRRLVDGTVNNCPLEVTTTMRCVKRDGSMKCIYSKWTKWSKCIDGIRHKTRQLIQGSDCDQITRIVQNCAIHRRHRESSSNSDSVIR